MPCPCRRWRPWIATSLYLLSFAIFVHLYLHLILFLLFHPYTSPFVFLLLYNLGFFLPDKLRSSIFPLLITCPTNLIYMLLSSPVILHHYPIFLTLPRSIFSLYPRYFQKPSSTPYFKCFYHLLHLFIHRHQHYPLTNELN